MRGEAPDELVGAVEAVVTGAVEESELRSSGYVVHTLQTALYDAHEADSAKDAIVQAVNRGGDTDTVGAVAGAVAGARFGADALPERWVGALDSREELESVATSLSSGVRS